MEQIINQRSNLLNYFFNEEKEYSKLEILNKEFAALSFSPREEYIDAFTTEFDEMLTPIEDLEDDHDEVLLKGIITDVDIKKDYCMIHIQNKSDNISISCDKPVMNKYSDYLNKGDIILAKCHTWNGKIYMHFMINYSTDDSFLLERNYLKGISKMMVDDIDYTHRLDTVGLIKQVKYFKSKAKGTPCCRLQVYEKGKSKTYITCMGFPRDLVAGMFVSYSVSNNPAFCNNLQQTRI